MISDLSDGLCSKLCPLLYTALGVIIGGILTWKFTSKPAAKPGTYSIDYDLLNSTQERAKMVLVVRTDLKMGVGKIASQCGHTILECYKSCLITDPKLVHFWDRTGQTTVVVKTDTKESMYELQAKAESLGLTSIVFHDTGKTQIAAGSATVLGIGPGSVPLINQVTDSLKLF